MQYSLLHPRHLPIPATGTCIARATLRLTMGKMTTCMALPLLFHVSPSAFSRLAGLLYSSKPSSGGDGNVMHEDESPSLVTSL
mmetsp:Transcript_5870/g.13936  ORF Transcript_5870/g.13936 Transcript_5870/m.13936 type:complete len:83 (-) Transcript_5870:2432-2680(-)